MESSSWAPYPQLLLPPNLPNTASQLPFPRHMPNQCSETFDDLSLPSSKAFWPRTQALNKLFLGDISKSVSLNLPLGSCVLAKLLASVSPWVSSLISLCSNPALPLWCIECSLISSARRGFPSSEFHSTLYMVFHAYHNLVCLADICEVKLSSL